MFSLGVYHMVYNEGLANRVRQALSGHTVEEKKMFGGVCFMVNGKMCITVGKDRLMCRIDPTLHETAIAKNGVKTVVMRGREYKGYVHVLEDSIKSQRDFDYWINFALEYNETAKSSKGKE
jgi:TfoX/Sxy family transcriptional regulator of competence genes